MRIFLLFAFLINLLASSQWQTKAEQLRSTQEEVHHIHWPEMKGENNVEIEYTDSDDEDGDDIIEDTKGGDTDVTDDDTEDEFYGEYVDGIKQYPETDSPGADSDYDADYIFDLENVPMRAGEDSDEPLNETNCEHSCPRYYRPVCINRNGDLVTFGTPCEFHNEVRCAAVAKARGVPMPRYRVEYLGTCALNKARGFQSIF